jgi:hypothetical protein
VGPEKEVGRHADGNNLYLSISPTGSRRWTFLYDFAHKQREAGLGSVSVVSLAEAREKAAQFRSLLAKGIDPLDQKKASQEAAAARKSFGQCASELIASKRREWRSEIHAGQWRSTIDRYCAPILDLPVGEVDTVQVLRCLQPIWNRIPEKPDKDRRGASGSVVSPGARHSWVDGRD